MITHGYCPWCGKDIVPMAHSSWFAEIWWDKCGTPRCQGNNLELVTDFGGWVLKPARIEGRYILKKPDKKRKR